MSLYVTMKVLLIYQAFKGKFAEGKLQLNKNLYMKQLVTVKCHISIYILENSIRDAHTPQSREIFLTP